MGNPFVRCRLRLWFLLEWAPGLKTPDRVVELNGVPTFGLGDTVHEGSGFGGNQPARWTVDRACDVADHHTVGLDSENLREHECVVPGDPGSLPRRCAPRPLRCPKRVVGLRCDAESFVVRMSPVAAVPVEPSGRGVRWSRRAPRRC